MLNPKFEKQYLILLIFIFITFGFLYSYVTPFNGAPDEAAHLNYISFIAKNVSLPNPSLVGGGPLLREFHQPPLYYILSTPIFILAQKVAPNISYIFIRIFSLSFGVLTVYLVLKISQIIFKKNLYLRLGMPTLVVSVSMFVFMTSVVNNDALAIFLGTLLILLSLLILKKTFSLVEKKFYILSGLVVGFSLLSKVTIYPFAVVFLVILLWKSIKTKKSIKNFLIFTIAFSCIIAGPWFLRNYLIQGDILGWRNLKLEFFPEQQFLSLNIVTLGRWFDSLFGSFWGKFGQFSVNLSRDIYLLLKLVSLLSFIGIISYFTTKWQKLDSVARQIFKFFLAVLAINFLIIILFNLRFYQPQGRYLFPTISAFAVYFCLGMYEIIPKRLKFSCFIFLFLAMVMLNIISIIRIASFFD